MERHQSDLENFSWIDYWSDSWCGTATGKRILLLGTLFVGALKAIAPILVFILVMSSLAQANGKVGKQFTTVIVLYMLSTLLAAVLAVFVSFAFPITLQLTDAVSESAPSGIGEVLGTLLNNIVSNPGFCLDECELCRCTGMGYSSGYCTSSFF